MDYREDQEIRMDHIQARGIIVRDKKLLMMFRRKKGEEYYVFPGGHMQIGEKPIETATREIEEETTVKCKNLKPAFEVTDYADGKTKMEYFFIGEIESGEPKLSGEESRRMTKDNFYKPLWVSFKDFPDLVVYTAQAKEWVLMNVINKKD